MSETKKKMSGIFFFEKLESIVSKTKLWFEVKENVEA